MFLINSRFPLFSATPQRLTPQECSHRRAPLLPKLRGHFAEFLNHSSPERLSILYLITCVGFGYGPCTHIARGFSRQHRITTITPMGYASRLTHMTTAFDSLSCHTLAPQSNKWRSYLTASPHHVPTTDQAPRITTNHPPRKVGNVSDSGWLVSPLQHTGRAYTGTGISTR